MSRQEKIRKAVRWGMVALVAVVVTLLVEPLLPMSQQQRERNIVSVEERHCFVLEANGNPVLYIQNLLSDWADWPLSVEGDSAACHTDTIEGCWADRFYGLPSCRGRVVIPDMSYAVDSVLRSVNANIKSFVEHQHSVMRRQEKKYTEMNEELDYYLEANNVTDEGYNTIATYATYVVKYKRRLAQALHVLDSLLPTDSLVLRRICHNTVLLPVMDEQKRSSTPMQASDGQNRSSASAQSYIRIPCHDDASRSSLISSLSSLLSSRGYYRRIQTDDRKTPRGVCADFFARPQLDTAAYKAYAVRRDFPAFVYEGQTTNGQREGHGIFIDRLGNYYNGMWTGGQRNGFGSAVDSTGKVRVGEWKDDRFLGQRLTYTEERIYGIDISRYQHDIGKKHYAIDWSKVRISHLGTISKKRVSGTVDYPVSFCFIKATEGITIRNNYFAADYAAARRKGIRVGCYHFFSTKSSAAEQARFFIQQARFNRGDMPPVLDVEPTDAQVRAMGGPEAMFNRIRTWMKTVEKHCGQRPILYVGQNFVNKYLGYAPDIKRDYQVWIARYGEYKPDVRLAFWQLCPDGRVNGIVGTVDINVFNGYRDQYDDFLERYTIK